MPKVKPRAPENRRAANFAATQAHVVAAASRLFLSQGYARTTIADIAREAGVAVQTVYNAVGGKGAVLKRVFEAAVAGPAAPRTVPEVMRERTRDVGDGAALAQLLADWFAEVHERMGPLWRVIDEAAAHDDEVAAFARERALARLRNYGDAADALRRAGAGSAGLDRDGTAALIWAVGHPQVYATLVGQQGWSTAKYRKWVSAALRAAFASPGQRAG